MIFNKRKNIENRKPKQILIYKGYLIKKAYKNLNIKE